MDKATEIKPDYAEAWNNKGLSLYFRRKYDEALLSL
ncbi:MAG: tetratricopeptide repeat protein [Methanotrichaceae archaeon]